MELLVVISHPGQAIRPIESIASDLAGAYDKAYDGPSTRHTLRLPHASLILLRWGPPSLGWSSWYEDDHGTLATAGLPLLFSPPDGPSAMLTPDNLSGLVRQAADKSPADLAFCGGYFAAAHADPQGTVRLATNYLAEVPLYRASQAGVTVWSNKAAAAAMLAGLKPKLDPQAAHEFIVLSHCLENRTLWQGVEAEPPATFITIDQNGASSRPYLDLPTAYFAYRQPKQQAADYTVRAMEPLVEAMRNSDRDIKIHLSGGQDSRAVAAICRRYGFRPICITHNTPNEEVASAKRLARYLNMPYRTRDGHVPALDVFLDQAQQSIWQSDGMMSLKYHAGRYDMIDIRDQGYVPLEGLGGEYGRAYYYGTDPTNACVADGRFDPVFKKSLSNRKQWWPNTDQIERMRDTIASLLSQAQSSGLSTYQTTTWYYVNQKMRRWATARRNIGWAWVIDPLQMPCWTYVGMSAAPEDQRGDALIRAVIDTAWPGTTGVPTVPQLAYAARRRRIASNRIVRYAMSAYDRFLRPADPEPWQTQTLRQLRNAFSERIADTEQHISGVIAPHTADALLDEEPWSYDQTEMYWHSFTLAAWCNAFLNTAPPILPCHATQTAVRQGPPA